MRKKLIALVGIFTLLAPIILISSTDAATNFFVLSSVKQGAKKLTVTGPKSGVLTANITQKAPTRPKITLNFSTVPAKGTKTADIEIKVTPTSSTDKRNITLTGQLKIVTKSSKITGVSVVGNSITISGKDSAGVSVTGTITGAASFIKGPKLISFNTDTLMNEIEGIVAIGTIGKEVGSYTYSVTITGVIIKYKGKAVTTIGGTLTVN